MELNHVTGEWNGLLIFPQTNNALIIIGLQISPKLRKRFKEPATIGGEILQKVSGEWEKCAYSIYVITITGLLKTQIMADVLLQSGTMSSFQIKEKLSQTFLIRIFALYMQLLCLFLPSCPKAGLSCTWVWTWFEGWLGNEDTSVYFKAEWNELGILLLSDSDFDQSMPTFWVSNFSCWKLFRELFPYHFLDMSIRHTQTEGDKTKSYPATSCY